MSEPHQPAAARPLAWHLLSFLPALAAALLALFASACAKEVQQAPADTLAPPAVAADSGAGAGARPDSAAPATGATADSASARRDSVPRASAPAGRTPRVTRDEVDRLYAAARALARTGGCASAGDCRAAPAGQRGCGGPSEFIIYCPATTDVAKLQATLATLERTEREYNRVNQVGSTCEMRMAPALTLAGGRCVAAP